MNADTGAQSLWYTLARRKKLSTESCMSEYIIYHLSLIHI